MQEWRKVLLVGLFIMSIIGGLIGFFMAKSGMGKVNIWADVDVFTIFMLILLAIAFISIIIDIYRMHKSKIKFGYVKFKLMIKTRKRARNIFIFLILDTIFIFGLFLNSPTMHMFPLVVMILIQTFMHGLHYKANNGISENGILHWGIYHNWNDVKSYKIENETLLVMNILSKSFGFKYNNEIKFNFDRELKDDIESFLSERV